MSVVGPVPAHISKFVSSVKHAARNPTYIALPDSPQCCILMNTTGRFFAQEALVRSRDFDWAEDVPYVIFAAREAINRSNQIPTSRVEGDEGDSYTFFTSNDATYIWNAALLIISVGEISQSPSAVATLLLDSNSTVQLHVINYYDQTKNRLGLEAIRLAAPNVTGEAKYRFGEIIESNQRKL